MNIFSLFSSWKWPVDFPPTFSAWGAGINRLVQCRREAQAQCGGQGQQHTLWLHVESTTSPGRSTGEHKRGLGEVSCCGLCRAKSVRICFHTCANILSTPIFCRRQYFVDANILSMPTFCWRQYFVDANFLLTPILCRHHYVLSVPIFCRRQCFVGAKILSVLRF